MSWFVEVDGDMGAYDMTELEAWKRYSQEIIDAKENGETYTITIGESLEDGAIDQYSYDESTFDTYCNWVLDQIVNAAGRVCCDDCDYTLSKPAFEAGKGRIMFDDLEDGKYRCGVCDDRVSDPQGIFPDDSDDDSDDCPHCGFDRGDHDVSDGNRLIPCESDGERD